MKLRYSAWKSVTLAGGVVSDVGVSEHARVSDGRSFVVPQLLLSLQVFVCIPSAQTDHSSQLQFSEQEHAWARTGRLVIVPQELASVHVRACCPSEHEDHSPQLQFSVHIGSPKINRAPIFVPSLPAS
jgi:hypothetical protein